MPYAPAQQTYQQPADSYRSYAQPQNVDSYRPYAQPQESTGNPYARPQQPQPNPYTPPASAVSTGTEESRTANANPYARPIGSVPSYTQEPSAAPRRRATRMQRYHDAGDGENNE